MMLNMPTTMPPTTRGPVNTPIFDDVDELSGSDARASRGNVSVLSKGRSFYERTYALLVHWNHDEARRREIIELGSTLKHHYLADCEEYTIMEEETVQKTFEGKIRGFCRKARAGKNLLLFFYTGSSGVVDGRFVLENTDPSISPGVIEWNSLLKVLTGQRSDVLFVLDCAYLIDDHPQSGSSCIEILAASDGTAVTDISSANSSLMQSLENVLRNAKGASISVSNLPGLLEGSEDFGRPIIHKILSRKRTDGIRITIPASKGRGFHTRVPNAERSGLLRLRLDANKASINPAESKSAIKDWIEDTRDAAVSTQVTLRDHDGEVEFRAQEDKALDQNYWQSLMQSRPAVVSNAEFELDQPQQTSHKTKVNTLVESLQMNKALQKVLPNKYTRVRVLTLMWEDVEKHLAQEVDLNQVCTVFRDVYNYEVHEIYRIKSEINATTALKVYINKMMNVDEGSDMLLIVVYGGHGETAKKRSDGQHSLKLTDTLPSKCEIDWSSVQSDLEQARCDTLTIMNCCYGGNASLGDENGTNELLSAADRDTKTYTLDKSFLRVLSKELEIAGQKGGTNISALHQRVDNYNKPGHGNIKAPFRHRDPITKPSIWLRPLPHKQPPATINEAVDESFYVEFFLRNPEHINHSHYNEFFKNWDVPSTVKAIRFYKKDELQKVP